MGRSSVAVFGGAILQPNLPTALAPAATSCLGVAPQTDPARPGEQQNPAGIGLSNRAPSILLRELPEGNLRPTNWRKFASAMGLPSSPFSKNLDRPIASQVSNAVRPTIGRPVFPGNGRDSHDIPFLTPNKQHYPCDAVRTTTRRKSPAIPAVLAGSPIRDRTLSQGETRHAAQRPTSRKRPICPPGRLWTIEPQLQWDFADDLPQRFEITPRRHAGQLGHAESHSADQPDNRSGRRMPHLGFRWAWSRPVNRPAAARWDRAPDAVSPPAASHPGQGSLNQSEAHCPSSSSPFPPPRCPHARLPSATFTAVQMR